MFCTQCGTQIDQGKNFCRNCGARIGRAAEPFAADVQQPTLASRVEPAAHVQSVSIPAPRERRGINNKAVMVAAGVFVILVAAGGIYFSMDRTKPAEVQTAANVAAPAGQSTEAPALPSFEETKDRVPAGDSSPASVNPASLRQSAPPAQSDTPRPPSELLSQPERKRDTPSPPIKSQFKRAGEEAAPVARTSRPAPAAPSRAGSSAGIYETVRATTVYEDPSSSSKVLASIAPGTRVNVVSSNGEWLEVHSRRGNPPGFIRRSDANLIESSN